MADLNDLLKISAENQGDMGVSPTTIGTQHESPQLLHDMYAKKKIVGALVDDEEVPSDLRRMARYYDDALKDLTSDMAWEDSSDYQLCRGRADEVGRRLQWHEWLQVDPTMALKGAQATGDCVSWAIRGAIDRLRCIAILEGAAEEYRCRQATCGLYACRGHRGQGASPGLVSEAAVAIGVLLEQEYLDGRYDFRNYRDYVAWGIKRGRVGMPDDLLEITQQHTSARTYRVRTWEGFVDGLAAGHTAHAGSMLGVSSRGDPVSSSKGSWAHDMDFPGFDVSREDVREEVVFGDNSWGNWNRVTNLPRRWEPWGQGMFAITRRTFEREVLRRGSVYLFVRGKYFPSDKVVDNLLI